MSGDEPTAKRLKGSGNDIAFQDPQSSLSLQHPDINEPSRLLGLPTPIPAPAIPSAQQGRDSEPENRSRQSTASGADEVADVYTETRMLQDPTGRLCEQVLSCCA